MRFCIPAGGTLALLVLAARAAWALWVQYDVLPKSLEFEGRVFAVQAAPADGRTTFTVTVTAKKEARKNRLSPFTTGYLNLPGLAQVPIEGKREGEKIVYWFKLTPKALHGADFEIHESLWTRSRDESGKPEILMGGTIYRIVPANFLH